ncbi:MULTISPECIES: hypothetical protein [unclassified Streptomyces]|uniref:hypothetical protein n=1 Tax=unclassified Streptomyces TaxID=2593676 RepID=UPI000A6671CB|nr:MULTISPECIES: hypothetical protein [unclassified Streptomyces]
MSPSTSAPRKLKKAAKAKKKPDWIFGPTPRDIFSPAGFDPEPKGPEARHIPEIERLALVVANPALYEVATAVLPGKEPGTRGRTPHYPPYVFLIYVCALSVFNTARSTEANLQHKTIWEIVREGVRRCLGDDEADSLPDTGPQRHHWMQYRSKMLDVLPQLREASRDAWIKQAIALGYLSEERPRGCWLRPDRSQVINGDATVVRPPSDQTEEFTLDEKTGEMRRHRVDPDAGIQIEGGDRAVYGKKIVSFSVRLPERAHSRIILNADGARHRSPEEDPDRAEEASTALRLAHEILDRAPGVIAAVFDTAWRGTHRARLVARGIVVYTPQHDGISPRPLKKYRYDHCIHDVYAAAGRSCERHISVDGQTVYTPLPVRELPMRSGVNSHRFYHAVEIHCRNGPHIELIPVYETKEDRSLDPRTKRPKFNRCEHLRQIPPNTDLGDRLKGFRQDSESTNCTLDYSHWDKRLPAYGAPGALLIYLGFAWMINSIALGTVSEPRR